MMSRHRTNPTFFNKKVSVRRSEHSLTAHPPTFDNISFLPYPPPPHSPQSGRHMCITPKFHSFNVNIESFQPIYRTDNL